MRLFYWFLSTFLRGEIGKYRISDSGVVYRWIGFWPDGEDKEKVVYQKKI